MSKAPISALEKEYEEVLEEYKQHIIRFIRRTWRINRKLRRLIRSTDFRKQPEKIFKVLDRLTKVFVALYDEVDVWLEACNYEEHNKIEMLNFLLPDEEIIEEIKKA
ncbi:MAG: hypothetical protein NDF55_10285 [archaeon GB-1867-005]|nr:hypothetical protein [Candidatus Culexmicrobium cathedralense]